MTSGVALLEKFNSEYLKVVYSVQTL